MNTHGQRVRTWMICARDEAPLFQEIKYDISFEDNYWAPCAFTRARPCLPTPNCINCLFAHYAAQTPRFVVAYGPWAAIFGSELELENDRRTDVAVAHEHAHELPDLPAFLREARNHLHVALVARLRVRMQHDPVRVAEGRGRKRPRVRKRMERLLVDAKVLGERDDEEVLRHFDWGWEYLSYVRDVREKCCRCQCVLFSSSCSCSSFSFYFGVAVLRPLSLIFSRKRSIMELANDAL